MTTVAHALSAVTKKVHDVTHKGLVELYVIAGVAGILALVSAFGFIGCIAKKLPLVVAYHVMIWVLLVVNIAASAFVLTGAWGRGGFEVRILAAHTSTAAHLFC
jgi:hypothetical protein